MRTSENRITEIYKSQGPIVVQSKVQDLKLIWGLRKFNTVTFLKILTAKH